MNASKSARGPEVDPLDSDGGDRVEQAQGVPKLAPRMMNPHSKFGIALLHQVLKLASQPVLRKGAVKLFSRQPEVPDLTRYA